MLRGINIGSRRRVSMSDLRAAFEALGADEVQTYVQSGNVVFRSADAAGKLVGRVERKIHAEFGADVAVIVRTQAEMARVLKANPFLQEGSDTTALHVTFLAEKPDPAKVRGLTAPTAAADEFAVIGREVYLHCPDGYGRTKLNNAFFEKKLGVAATTRNWKTVTALADLARA
jgi:uncharacterized protein (DUF1697 family)